jgi:hypothetical protein
VTIPEAAVRIAELEAEAEALREALRRRSRELRLVQRHVAKRDLIVISRLLAGLPPLPEIAYDVDYWQETTALVAVDVEDAMRDLWRSLTPPADDDELD